MPGEDILSLCAACDYLPGASFCVPLLCVKNEERDGAALVNRGKPSYVCFRYAYHDFTMLRMEKLIQRELIVLLNLTDNARYLVIKLEGVVPPVNSTTSFQVVAVLINT